MSGDVSGSGGQIKFQLSGFPEGQKVLGGKTLADVIMADFEAIMKKFKASLEGNLGDLKKLRTLAAALLKLSNLLNSITTSTENPQAVASQIESSISQVAKDIGALFKNHDDPYYKALISSLDSVKKMLKGGAVQVIVKLIEAMKNLNNWWKSEFHKHGRKGYISNHKERDKMADKLASLLKNLDGYRNDLNKMIKDWDTGIMGPVPHSLKEIADNINGYWSSLMHLTLYTSFGGNGNLKEFWDDYRKGKKDKLGQWIAGALYAGKDGKNHWHKAKNYWFEGAKSMFSAADKAIDYATKHQDVKISAEAIIKAIRQMGQDTSKGHKLRKELPFIWNHYQQAMRSVDEMITESNTLGNKQVSNIYSKTTALQQLTKTLSKDLMVPIAAIDQSIARVFG